jgi:hypothetical protein
LAERRVLPMELLVGDRLANKRDRHRMGAHALARDAAGGVGGPQESGLRRLGDGSSLRHGFSESTLLLEQRGLSLSDQDIGSVADLLALFHEALRRLPHCLCPESYFRGQHRAAEEMARTASVRSCRHRGHMFVRPPPKMSAASSV